MADPEGWIEMANSKGYRMYFQLAMAYRALGEKEKMARALAQYKKTSIDAKQRSNAQRELRPLEQQGEITEEAEARTSTVQ